MKYRVRIEELTAEESDEYDGFRHQPIYEQIVDELDVEELVVMINTPLTVVQGSLRRVPGGQS